jgi:uncharacterized protein (TIGR02246 family)
MQAMSRATFAAAAMLLAAVAGRAALHADASSDRFTVASGHARQELPDGPGKAELSKLCAGCHDLMFTASTRETKDGWTRIVNDMRSKGADGTEADFAKVIAYLTAHMGTAAPSAAPPATRNSDEDAIKQVMAATTDAFSRHDARAWVKFCTPDAQLVTVRGEAMSGVGEIEKGLSAIFQTRGRNVTLKTLDVAVRFIRPDVALAHVTNELSGLVSPEGQTLPPHQELSIRVLVKDQGAWRIAAFHNTILLK